MEQVFFNLLSEFKPIFKSWVKEAQAEIQAEEPAPTEQNPDFLSEYIPKSEVRGKLASASTLWKYEKDGKLQSYGIGGKRFYKKADIENAFVKLNKKGGEK